jgi:probable rRNA maturation factor
VADLDLTTLIDIAPGVEPDPGFDAQLLVRAVHAAILVARDSESGPAWLDEPPPLEASVRITDNREIQSLNAQYRDVDTPTDVLSFSFVEDAASLSLATGAGPRVQLGEFVVSYEYCVRQAQELGHSADKELAWLSIHGALQLLGYVHDTDSAAEHMEALEGAALRVLGFDFP